MDRLNAFGMELNMRHNDWRNESFFTWTWADLRVPNAKEEIIWYNLLSLVREAMKISYVDNSIFDTDWSTISVGNASFNPAEFWMNTKSVSKWLKMNRKNLAVRAEY